MKNSGLADSPFFSKNPPKHDPVKEQQLSEPDLADLKIEEPSKTKAPVLKEKKEEPNHQLKHDVVIPRHHDTTTPRYRDTTIETIRKAVKQIGKEAATHRYTEAEKKAIANIVFTYKNRGVFTSENEISRIAVNSLFEDFEENGEESILAKCLKALND